MRAREGDRHGWLAVVLTVVALVTAPACAHAQWSWEPWLRVATALPRGEDRSLLRNGVESSLGVHARRQQGMFGLGAEVGRTPLRARRLNTPAGGYQPPDVTWDWWMLSTELVNRSRHATPTFRLGAGWGSQKVNGRGNGDLPLFSAGLGARVYLGHLRLDVDANQKAFVDIIDGAQAIRSFGVAAGVRW